MLENFYNDLLAVAGQLAINSGAIFAHNPTDSGIRFTFSFPQKNITITLLLREDKSKNAFLVDDFFSTVTIANRDYLGATKVLHYTLKPGEIWTISSCSNFLSLFSEYNKWSEFFNLRELFVLNPSKKDNI